MFSGGLERLFPISSFRRKEVPPPEENTYDRILKAYRSWNVHERGSIIDFDLTAGPDFYEEVSKGFDYQATNSDRIHMEGVLHNLESELSASESSSNERKHITEFLIARLQASQWFLCRLREDTSIDNHDYLEKTSGLVLDQEIDKDFLISWRDSVFKQASDEGIPINLPESYESWRQAKKLTPQAVEEHLTEAANKSIKATERFTQRPANLEYSVERVKKNRYFYAWSKTDPETLEFVVQLNLYKTKVWTIGKAEELGGHEVCEHLRRMNDWREQIRKKKMPGVVGQTIVHGPEALVEEGLALIIAHYIPEIYDGLSREGKFQVDSSILRHMVYANVSLRLNGSNKPKVQEVIDYVHEFLPWESPKEIRRQINARTKDPTDQAYLPMYGFGAKLFLDIMAILNLWGRKQLLRELSERPFTPVQLKKRALELSVDRKNNNKGSLEIPSQFPSALV